MDTLIWTPDKAGKFYVKACSLELAKARCHHHLDSVKGIWRGLVPYRIEIFTWFAILGRLNTKHKLVRLGTIPISDSLCVFCKFHHENSEHLFLHCDLSRKLWCWWMHLWGISVVSPFSLKDAFDKWFFPNKGAFFKKVWAASFFIILWTI